MLQYSALLLSAMSFLDSENNNYLIPYWFRSVATY